MAKYNINDLNYWKDVGVDGTIILKHILNKQLGECGLDLSGSGQG
jgi:hypothetical protein